MYIETINASTYKKYRLDSDYLLAVGKGCSVPIEGTKVAGRKELEKNEMSVPVREVLFLGKIEKIEYVKKTK
jgi:hypothetical protein